MGKHPIKTYVLKYKTRLHAELVKLKLKLKVKSLATIVDGTGNSENGDDKDNVDVTPVRWIRINPLRCHNGITVDSVLNELRKKFTNKVDHWNQIVPGSIYYDEYIPHLYGIHPGDKITSHELYKQGRIIIQDRASCFPAHILNPTKDDIIIDGCAAPGNKTTHVASYMFGRDDKNDEQITKTPRVQIHAFEKDPKRAQVLSKMIKIAGCFKQISVNVGDFTKLSNAQKFPGVTGFILDPSCSGSGIFGRKYVDSLNRQRKQQEQKDNDDDEEVPDEQEEYNKNEDLKTRLAKLSSFQFQVVKHAMVNFPDAKRLVYSTCSIHAEENERVVIDLLLDAKVKEAGWRVASRDTVIPTWSRRGFVDEFKEVFNRDSNNDEECERMAQGCIRALPKEDGGIGFFAVCFERDV